MSRPRRIYVAAPIGLNDAGRPQRIANAAAVAAELIVAGFAVYLPHGYEAAGIDLLALVGYDRACAASGVWLETCDALLWDRVRCPGESPGAVDEVTRMRALARPVFHATADVIAWGPR